MVTLAHRGGARPNRNLSSHQYGASWDPPRRSFPPPFLLREISTVNVSARDGALVESAAEKSDIGVRAPRVGL